MFSSNLLKTLISTQFLCLSSPVFLPQIFWKEKQMLVVPPPCQPSSKQLILNDLKKKKKKCFKRSHLHSEFQMGLPHLASTTMVAVLHVTEVPLKKERERERVREREREGREGRRESLPLLWESEREGLNSKIKLTCNEESEIWGFLVFSYSCSVSLVCHRLGSWRVMTSQIGENGEKQTKQRNINFIWHIGLSLLNQN